MCLKFPRKIEVKLRFCMLYRRSGGQVRSVEEGQCSPKKNQKCSVNVGIGGRYSWQIRRGNNTMSTGYKTYDQPVVGTSRPARTSLRNILRRHVTKIRSLNIFMAKNVPHSIA